MSGKEYNPNSACRNGCEGHSVCCCYCSKLVCLNKIDICNVCEKTFCKEDCLQKHDRAHLWYCGFCDNGIPLETINGVVSKCQLSENHPPDACKVCCCYCSKLVCVKEVDICSECEKPFCETCLDTHFDEVHPHESDSESESETEEGHYWCGYCKEEVYFDIQWAHGEAFCNDYCISKYTPKDIASIDCDECAKLFRNKDMAFCKICDQDLCPACLIGHKCKGRPRWACPLLSPPPLLRQTNHIQITTPQEIKSTKEQVIKLTRPDLSEFTTISPGVSVCVKDGETWTCLSFSKLPFSPFFGRSANSCQAEHLNSAAKVDK